MYTSLTTASTIELERELTNSTLPDLDGLAVTLHVFDKVKPTPRVILVHLGVPVCPLSDDQVIHALLRILCLLKRSLHEHCGNLEIHDQLSYCMLWLEEYNVQEKSVDFISTGPEILSTNILLLFI